jgi:hypothetical protein
MARLRISVIQIIELLPDAFQIPDFAGAVGSGIAERIGERPDEDMINETVLLLARLLAAHAVKHRSWNRKRGNVLRTSSFFSGPSEGTTFWRIGTRADLEQLN